MTREEAIKWLIKPARTSTDIGEIKAKEIEAYNVAIEALSGEAVQGWIPVSERLPDERQDVYVTVLWDDYGDYITAHGMRTKFGWNLHSNAEGELIKGYTVVAWMPLPEPYREDGEA